MEIELILWIVLGVAVAIGGFFGLQAVQVWHRLVGEGRITGWRLPMAKLFSFPELSRPYIRASVAGVVAAICVVALHQPGLY